MKHKMRQQGKQQNNGWNLFKVNIKDTRTTSFSGVFIVHFEQISHIILVFSLLALNK